MLGSGLASRTPASLSVLLILAGAVAGSGGLGVIDWSPDDPRVAHFARWALVAVLYTDGMRMALGPLRRAWHLPGRALLLGMPLTFAAIAVLAHVLAGLPWLPSLLVAGVLSPTDRVLASAVVERREVPEGLRRLLNVESGLNDGLALPVVLVLLSLLGSGLSRRQRWVAAWFGPKGFASLIYAIHVLRSGIADAPSIHHLVAVVITLSILAHSSTDVGAARWVQHEPGR